MSSIVRVLAILKTISERQLCYGNKIIIFGQLSHTLYSIYCTILSKRSKSVFCKHATNHRISIFGITCIDIYLYWVIYQHSYILLLGQKKMNKWRGYKESESCSARWKFIYLDLSSVFSSSSVSWTSLWARALTPSFCLLQTLGFYEHIHT